MTSLILAFMMQYVVATKAGLVNDIKGMTNVKPSTMVSAATPVRTGPSGFVELLLTPGSYLRMGENSEVVLDNVELTNVAAHVNAGSAMLEVVEIDPAYPIRVTTGETVVEIRDAGIFSFHNGTVSVLEGKLETVGEPRTIYKKGWQVSYSLNYRSRKMSETELFAALNGLDKYSQQRSALMARANVDLAPTMRPNTYPSNAAFWYWSSAINGMTYMPMRNIRSPYGYWYNGINFITYGGRATSNNNSVDSSGGNRNASTNSGTSSSSSGSSGASSGGSPTFSTPSGGSSSAGTYIGGKSAPVGASQPRP